MMRMRSRGKGVRTVALVSALICLGCTSLAAERIPDIDLLRNSLAEGDLLAAEHGARQLLVRIEAAGASDPIALAEALDDLVESRLRQWCYTDAEVREGAERALAIKQRLLRRDDPRKVASLVNQATVVQFERGYGVAIPLFERALRVAEAADEGRDELMARALLGLGIATRYSGATGEALDLLEGALAHQRRAAGSGHPSVARVLNKLASLQVDLLDRRAARRSLDEALEIVQRFHGAEHPMAAPILSRIAILEENFDALEAGQPRLEQALRIGLAAYDAEHPIVARAREGLARMALARGDYENAEKDLRRVLAIYESRVGPFHARFVSVLRTLAWLHYNRADHAKVRHYFARALPAARKALGPGNPARINVFNIYGLFLRQIGDYQQAREIFESIIAERRPLAGPMDTWLSVGMGNLAATAHAQGDLREADELYGRSLRLYREIFGPGTRAVQKTLFMHGALLVQLGEVERARPMLIEALELGERALGVAHPETADACEQLGILEVTLGNPGRAREYLERALRIREESFGASSPKTGGSLVLLSRLLAGTGHPEPGLNAALRAEAIGRRSLRLTARLMPERQGLRYASVRNRGLDVALSVLARDRELARKRGREVWDAVVRSRALVLDEMATRHRKMGELPGPEARVRLKELDDVRTRAANLVMGGPGILSAERYRQLLEELGQRREELETILAEQTVEVREERSRQRVRLDDVIAALPDGTALISYTSYDRETVTLAGEELPEDEQLRDIGASPPYATPFVPAAGSEEDQRAYLAFVGHAGRENVAVVPLGSAERIDQLVADWRSEAGTRPRPLSVARRRDERNYLEAGSRLRRAIWDPLVEHLGEAEQILVVPAHTLHFVNLATLPDERSDFLLESGPVFHYVSAERDLARPHEGLSGEGLLALGGVDFDAFPRGPAQARSTTGVESEGRGDLALRSAAPSWKQLQDLEFAPLPGSKREIEEISELWRSQPSASSAKVAKVVTMTGDRARELLVKRQAPRYRVLHLATHGFFFPADSVAGDGSATVSGNPLLECGVVLAGANRRAKAEPGQEDGLLTAEEIAALDLRGVEWAVLSACETGAGRLMSGEGVLGLRRAFQMAGARTLIMSLWPVEDEVTRQWMRELYTARLKGAPTLGAVREASLAIVEARADAGRSTHPFYWGGFVAAGDWR
jgi:CHAT domain-containing protein/tetratricopeptide (TPR) repeat protein